MAIFDPGTLLQLALFKETGPRTSRRTNLVGLLRIRLSALASDISHAAALPLCANRKQGGKIAATANLTIKARPHPKGIALLLLWAGHDIQAAKGYGSSHGCQSCLDAHDGCRKLPVSPTGVPIALSLAAPELGIMSQ